MSKLRLLGIVALLLSLALIILAGCTDSENEQSNSSTDENATENCEENNKDTKSGGESRRYWTPNDVVSADKPIIYLYPETTTEVTVTLANPENLTCTYPTYDKSWTVEATPEGTLTDVKTGRRLYALYYESVVDHRIGADDTGFCVAGKDSASFLEEKLAQLGLNEREAEEFIVYWLPQLEENPYNYIRFATVNEIDESLFLTISPTPDTTIRVMMEFKPLDSPIEIVEQQLITPSREGFCVVEWGGSKIG